MSKVTLSDSREIEIREPLVRDILAVKDYKNEEEKGVRLVGNLTNMTPEEIGAIKFKDFALLQKELGDFLS
ncbi:MAG: phage tail assembly protein [Helicobacteraceae bacterium]|jgi:hypothetical protein|nr:phage tail assembly protein [Helicobacteraceae bacterium]